MDEIIIMPKNMLEKELLLNKQLVKSNFLDMKYFLDNYIYTYNEEAIYFLMKNYKYKYDIAKMYLENIKYIFDIENSQNININKLIQIREILIKNNLLKCNLYFKNYIKNKKIIIKGHKLNKFELKIFKNLNYEIIDNINKENKHQVFSFNTIQEEIEYIGNDICYKIKNGIEIGHIVICNYQEEYHNNLKKTFKMLKIPCSFNKFSLYEVSLVKNLINDLKTDKNKQLVINKYKYLEEEILNKILAIFNKYCFCDVDDIFIECFIKECMNTYITKNKKNSIRFEDLNEYEYQKEDYVYLIGMNNRHIPKIKKDEQFLNNNICQILNIDTTIDINIIEKELVINKINSIKNLTITYKEQTPFEIYYKSSLIDELNMEIIKNPIHESSYKNSNMLNKIHLAIELDNYNLYNKKTKILEKLYKTYDNIEYKSYDNKFKGINKNSFLETINKNLLLSYTSLNTYYHCSFKYYIENILKLKMYEETLSQKTGNIFHYILSKAFINNFNFEQEWTNYHLDKIYTNKEWFFINKLKNDLLFLIETIKEHNEYTSLNEELYEEKIYIDKSKDIKITFMGVIDKIKYKEENGYKYAAIIDYKTGEIDINLKNINYGLNMQLPIYVYLLKKNSNWCNVEITGFYLQKIISKEEINKDYIETKKNNLKLIGYSNSNLEILKQFDNNFENSQVIKSMKMTKNGIYAYAKTINNEKIDKIVELVDEKIDNAIENIIECNFNINPKNINNELIGCKYCKYEDLCYKGEKNIIYLKGSEEE